MFGVIFPPHNVLVTTTSLGPAPAPSEAWVDEDAVKWVDEDATPWTT